MISRSFALAAFAALGLLAGLPQTSIAAPAAAASLQLVRSVQRLPVDPDDAYPPADTPHYATRGDKSGYPGGNEFNPTAPFGGQAAVTARPGTDAYDEQMNQRRYFCEYSSNRC